MEEKSTRELGERLQKEEKNSKAMEERLEREEKSSKGLEERLQKTENAVSRLPHPINHHPGNAHQQYYALTNSTATSAKLARVGGGSSWYNFVNRSEVLPDQQAKYAVKIAKATNS